ncbi:class I adenylate-forming enzyme family protein [Bacteroidota bacterium]
MNVFDYFFETTQNLNKDFVIGPKETISFKNLHEQSLKVASYFKEKVGTAKNIVLIGQNSVFFITVYLGILKSGNICIPLNFAIEQENLDFILETTASSTIVLPNNLISKLNFNDSTNLFNETDLSEIIENHNIKGVNGNFDKNNIAEIIFTSGSTGKPKGVMITHQNIIANTDSIIQYLKLTSKDIMLIVLPFFYCYGLSLLHTHLKVGASIVLNNSFIFLGTVLQNLKNYKCTGFAGVPSHFQILLKKSQNFKNTEFPDLRYVTQAGGKLHSIFIKEFVTAFPKIDFYVMYGQTEATARLSYLPPELLKHKMESIGKSIPGVELKIVNKKGMTAEVNEEGELLAKGENIMLGYYRDDLGTKKAIKNGWLHTGDIAKIDEDGFIYIVARIKEFIKVGGKRVSPKEIEEVIVSVPGVVDCTISGVFDDILGEAIQATIVLQNQASQLLMKEKILNACSEKLALYKIPQKIIFESDISLSITGKKSKT